MADPWPRMNSIICSTLAWPQRDVQSIVFPKVEQCEWTFGAGIGITNSGPSCGKLAAFLPSGAPHVTDMLYHVTGPGNQSANKPPACDSLVTIRYLPLVDAQEAEACR